jgi:TPR repeat protein
MAYGFSWAKCMLAGVLAATSMGLSAQQQITNELVRKWVIEAQRVGVAQHASLLEQARGGDVRATLLLFRSLDSTPAALRNQAIAAELGGLAQKMAIRDVPIGQGLYCVALVYGEFGVAKSPAVGLEYCQQAASKGLGMAMAEIGAMHRDGRAGLAKDDAQALGWFRKAAEAGYDPALVDVGWHAERGRGTAKNEVQAVAWYRKAAEASVPSGMRNLAVMYRDGRGGLEKDDAQALVWLRKAADAGFASVLYDIGWHYETGRGVPKDDAQAVVWYRKAAEAAVPIGMYGLARMYRDGKGGLSRDDVQALGLILKAADAGYTPALYEVGWHHEMGRGVPKDDAQAVVWYRKAAEAAVPSGMLGLARMYLEGKGGLSKDDEQALGFARKAAEARYAPAFHDVGWHHELGRGVPKDDAQAVVWYRKAAEAAVPMGMYSLARMYRDGKGGLTKDYAQAMAWFQKAAEAGVSHAMASIANLHGHGRGVPIDLQQSFAWNLKAAQAGSDHGMNNVAVNYLYGLGVEENRSLAYAWFRKAADARHPASMLMLGRGHAIGDGGLEKNESLAIQWLTKAITRSAEWEYKMTASGESSSQYIRREVDNLIAGGWIRDAGALKEAEVLAKPAPTFSWVNLPQSISDPSLQLRVRVRDTGGGIGRIELRVNGSAVGVFERAAARGATVASPAGGPGEDWVYTVTLPTGSHQLEVWAYNGENLINFSRSSRTITSSYLAPRKPRLYAVVVGVDQYEDRSLKLNFAGSDAEAIARQLQSQIDGGTLYSSGKVTLLMGKERTSKASIVQELKRHQSRDLVSGDDVFVLFVAGHGWFDTTTSRYYMFTSDVLHRSEDKLLQTSIVGEDLRDLVGNIPAQKKLLVLDTCNAGGFAREGAQSLVKARSSMGEQQIIEVMRARTGAAVFAASGTQQEAVEGYNGHGVFSYYLLEGLRGAALRQGKSLITTDDLKIYVEDQVPEAMARKKWGKQAPVVAVQGDGFPLAAKN